MIVLALISLFVLLMAFTGRLHWVAAVFAGLLPFSRNILPILIRAAPFIGAWYKRRQQTHTKADNQSEVNTEILLMRLDHDSGVMYGTVKSGPYAGKELGSLSESEFLNLLAYCREHDSESARLLEGYLDKRFGDSWRDDDATANPTQHSPHKDQEAYEILGLKPGCSREDIINAHRRLMQKNHPDRGGSDYLAAKINDAKDYLLDD